MKNKELPADLVEEVALKIHQCHYHPVDWNTKEQLGMFKHEKLLAVSKAQAALSVISPYYEKQIAELKAQIPQWLPIETHPEDGSYFLIWYGQVGCQNNEVRPLVTRVKDGLYKGLMFFDIPICWMPLPKPPTEQIT